MQFLTADKKVKLEWDIANPEEATSFTIEKINSLNNWRISDDWRQTNLHHYEILDNEPVPGENIYRLRIKWKRQQRYLFNTKKSCFKI